VGPVVVIPVVLAPPAPLVPVTVLDPAVVPLPVAVVPLPVLPVVVPEVPVLPVCPVVVPLPDGRLPPPESSEHAAATPTARKKVHPRTRKWREEDIIDMAAA